jgi:hypothetical protein
VTREGGFGLGKMRSWPFGAGGLVVFTIALLAAPAWVEGPMLVPISPGHALAVLDLVALIPLLVGLTWLYWGYGYAATGCMMPCVHHPGRVVWEYSWPGWGLASCSRRPSPRSGGGLWARRCFWR